MTTFMLLSDVTAEDAPTKLVPLKFTRELPLSQRAVPFGEFFEHEVAATAPAGSLLIYKTDIFHRGSDFTGVNRSRFMMLVDFQQRGWRWQGKMSWPDRAGAPEMCDAMVRMTPRARDLFGWPPPGSEYWNDQTLADVAARYPGIDMTPYLKPSAYIKYGFDSSSNFPYISHTHVVRMRMLDRLSSNRLKPELFVNFVERLDRIGDQQLGSSRENEQPRGVGDHLDQALALVGRIDHHSAKFEDFRREHTLEQLRRIEMPKRERRLGEASRPECANQRRTMALGPGRTE